VVFEKVFFNHKERKPACRQAGQAQRTQSQNPVL
jgi:hypothetical protein